MKVTLPDGSIKEYPGPVAPAQVAADIGAGLAKAAIGAKVDGQLWDLHRQIEKDCHLAIITKPRFEKDGRTKGAHNADALYQLAMANLNLGDIPAARTAFERYLKAAPNGDKAGQVKTFLEQLPK